MRSLMKIGWLVGLFVVQINCGMNSKLVYEKIRPQLFARNFEQAATAVANNKNNFYSKDNRLLYYMDQGMTLHLAGKYQESNKMLDLAKDTAEALWTESIGKNAAAWITTDNSLPYQGEDFEKVMLHFVAALNYMGMNNSNSARVEMRQMTNTLELLNSKYDTKSAYNDDAFARWLAARLSESDNTQEGRNQAWIDYRRSLEMYEKEYGQRYGTTLPELVLRGAVRCLAQLGPEFAPELTALLNKYPVAKTWQQPAVAQTVDPVNQPQMGSVVFLHLNGEAPYKVDRFWEATAGGDILRVAYPEFESRPSAIAYATIRQEGSNQVVRTQLMENINAIARQNLQDHMGRIQTKAVARAVAKFIAGKAAQTVGASQKGEVGVALQLIGLAWNIGNAIAEEADKRSWVTLPAQIMAAELPVSPGPVILEVSFHGQNGQILETAKLQANPAAGQTAFVSYRTFR